MQLIIDTDAGVDDAHALMMALAHPNAQVKAITTVTGNIGVYQVNRNVLTVLDIMRCDVPVYQGADRPLVNEWVWETEEFHGKDGLGDWPGRPPSQRQIETEHGVLALIRLLSESPGELTLVALGPMTNLALAVRLDPSLPRKVKQLIFMGGTMAGHGNTRIPTAEFNIYCDPEAAYIVLNTFPEATMISWEATLNHPLPWERYDELARMIGPRVQFFNGIDKWATPEMRNRTSSPLYLLPDPLAMAVALCPELIRQSHFRHVEVELNGTYTRGQTVIDYANKIGRPANVHVITEIDMDGVYQLYRQMLSS
jgi:purine nucleosidase